MFSTLPETNFNFWVTFILSSANAFNLDQYTNLLFGKELKAVLIQHHSPPNINPLPNNCFHDPQEEAFQEHG